MKSSELQWSDVKLFGEMCVLSLIYSYVCSNWMYEACPESKDTSRVGQ